MVYDLSRIEHDTFSDPEVAAAIATFIPVKVDIDKDTALAGKYAVDAVPAFMLIDKKSQVRGHIAAYKSPDELLAVLRNWGRVSNPDPSSRAANVLPPEQRGPEVDGLLNE